MVRRDHYTTPIERLVEDSEPLFFLPGCDSSTAASVLRQLLVRLAKAIEESEQQNGEAGAYKRAKEEMQIENRRGTAEQCAFGNRENGLVKMKQDKHKSEAADGMFRIDLCAHGRRKITH